MCDKVSSKESQFFKKKKGNLLSNSQMALFFKPFFFSVIINLFQK